MREEKKVAVIGVNWVGDAVMTLPALQAYRALNPAVHLVMVSKPKLEEFWSMCPVVDEIVGLGDGVGGILQAAATLSCGGFSCIYVMPNSFRSALVAFMSGIRRRVGFAGHWRRLLLTRLESRPEGTDVHQSAESFALLGLARPETGTCHAAMPLLSVKAEKGRALLPPEAGDRVAALLPGAARGPSKRWPLEYFGEIGRRLADEHDMTVVVLGTAPERGLCDGVAGIIGRRGINLAGRTGLKELAALLSCCRVVVCNDSGGMHLAAAMGTPTVGIYGTTDPRKTGPLGSGHRVVRERLAARSREIGRTSADAERHLRSIKPAQVWSAVEQVLDR